MIYGDTETTGTNQGIDLDIALSVAFVDGAGNELINTLIKPPSGIVPSSEALAINGITLDDLKNAPTFADIVPDLNALLIDSDTIYFYNAAFDYRILVQTAYINGVNLAPLQGRVACAMLQYTSKWGHKWQKLTAAIEQQELELLSAHDALSDTIMLKNLVQSMQNGYIKTPDKKFEFEFVGMSKRQTYKGDDYLCLESRGGQQLNIWQNRLYTLRDKGYPIDSWLPRLTDETRYFEHSQPIQIAVTYNDKGYLELAHIISEYATV